LPSQVNVERPASTPGPAPARTAPPQSPAPQSPRLGIAPKSVAAKSDEVASHRERPAETDTPPTVPQSPGRPHDEAPIRPPTSFAPQPETPPAPSYSELLGQFDLTPAAGTSSMPVPVIQPSPQPLQPHRMRTVGTEIVAPEDQKTEIHISIGSIELRAAPAEAKPPAPAPFRPRVSLQDFLTRTPEGRR